MAPPNQPVLVYDGDCAFCTRSARWIAARLPDPSIVRPAQSLDLPSLGLTPADADAAAWWVDELGRLFRGEAAIGKALVACGGVWRPIGRLLLIPPVSWLAKPVYAWIARNRSKMPGGTAACDLPTKGA